MPGYKLYRMHYCSSNHRSYRTMARCVWRRAHYGGGEGRYALVTCRNATVSLYMTSKEAEAEKERSEDAACGDKCIGRHKIIELVLP